MYSNDYLFLISIKFYCAEAKFIHKRKSLTGFVDIRKEYRQRLIDIKLPLCECKTAQMVEFLFGIKKSEKNKK